MLEKFFKLNENHTTVRTEVIAGITTFMAMAYILAVNPTMLGDTGMNRDAVLMATCLASFVGTMATLPTRCAGQWGIPGRLLCLPYLWRALFLLSYPLPV